MINVVKTQTAVTRTHISNLDEEEMRVIRMGLDFVLTADVGKRTKITANSLLLSFRENE